MRARARRRRRELCSWEKPTRAAMVSRSNSWKNRRGRRRGHQIAKTAVASRLTGWSSDPSQRLDTTVNAGDGGMVMDTRYLVGLALHEG
jgi:hypothetical protein